MADCKDNGRHPICTSYASAAVAKLIEKYEKEIVSMSDLANTSQDLKNLFEAAIVKIKCIIEDLKLLLREITQ